MRECSGTNRSGLDIRCYRPGGGKVACASPETSGTFPGGTFPGAPSPAGSRAPPRSIPGGGGSPVMRSAKVPSQSKIGAVTAASSGVGCATCGPLRYRAQNPGAGNGMPTKRSTFYPLLSSVALVWWGCYRTPMERSAGGRSSIPGNASPDLRPGDLAADRDPPRDLGADLRDLGLEFPHDLGRDSSPEHRTDVLPDTAPSVCTPGERYVLLLSRGTGSDSALYRFYPDTLSVARIATVSCGSTSLNSLTVSPLGPAYISNHSGELCVVDLTTFAASPTSFDAEAISNHRFGMAVLPDNVPAGQTLYIAVKATGQADVLSRVDLSTFATTTIGPIQLDQDAGLQARPDVELTAGSNGELYGFSIGTPQSFLLTIDPKTGKAIDVSTGRGPSICSSLNQAPAARRCSPAAKRMRGSSRLAQSALESSAPVSPSAADTASSGKGCSSRERQERFFRRSGRGCPTATHRAAEGGGASVFWESFGSLLGRRNSGVLDRLKRAESA